MNKLREKIIKHAKSNYNSSPHEYSDEDLNVIIEHDCECYWCGKSIFELNDFPEVCKDGDSTIVCCEECYDDHYRTVCCLCEDSYEKDEMSEYFFITKEVSKTVNKPHGLYKILSYPFFYGDCVTGFDAFFDGAIEKVSDLDITNAYSIINPNSHKDILMDCLCVNCAEKYLRKDNFIKVEPLYSILRKRERNNFFKDYTYERIHMVRQDMIHRRITFRGILQNSNKSKDYEQTIQRQSDI